MYRLKNIILGLGLGLVFASLININVQSKNITNDFIIKEAAKNGLIVIDPKDIINKNVDLVNINSIYKEDEGIDIEINIEKEFNLNDIAGILFNKELIDNKQEFIDYINDFNKKIQCGVFYIKKGSSIEEIINIITNQDG